MKELTKKYKKAQLFVSAECPSDCSYCYIPKSGKSTELNEEIKRGLLNGSYFENLKKMTRNLESITLMGAETSCNLDLFADKIDELKKEFPDLKKITIFSSIAYPEKVTLFINRCNDFGIDVRINASCSGPDFITEEIDKNQIMKEVPDNLKAVLSNIDKLNIMLTIKWKVTLPFSIIEKMVEDEKKIDRFISFFEDKKLELRSVNSDFNITIMDDISPDLVKGVDYSAENGRILAEFIKKAAKKNLFLMKNSAIKAAINEEAEFSFANCYAGNDSVSIGKMIHPCQWTFLYDRADYFSEAANSKKKMETSLVSDSFILEADDDKGKKRSEYLISTSNEFFKFKINHLKLMMKEMIDAGQIEKKYMNDNWIGLLLIVGDCFLESLVENKSIHLMNPSYVRLFCNGALEEMANIAIS